MKKLLAVLLCLALCLPVMACAETYTVDMGDFTIELGAADAYQSVPKTENEVFAIIYPNYDPNAESSPNLNVVWTTEDPSFSIRLHGAEAYGQALIEQTSAYLKSMGINPESYELLNAVYEDGVAAFYTYMVADYTGAGIPVKLTQYQMQMYYIHDANNVYIFTLTAGTAEELQAMLPYLDAITFK